MNLSVIGGDPAIVTGGEHRVVSRAVEEDLALSREQPVDEQLAGRGVRRLGADARIPDEADVRPGHVEQLHRGVGAEASSGFMCKKFAPSGRSRSSAATVWTPETRLATHWIPWPPIAFR